MITAFSVFAWLVILSSTNFFNPHHLDGLLFAFILYLIIRGIYLAVSLPSVMNFAKASSK